MRILLALIPALLLSACGGPEKVDLARTYKVMDDKDREAGTITFNPAGGGEVRDNTGRVIGTIKAH